MKDYLPHGDAELLLWLTNFNNKIRMHSATFNLMPADVADINTKGDALVQAVQDANTKKEEAAKSITHKNDVRSDFSVNVRKEVTRMKAHKSYTDAIGRELGIIGTSTSFDATGYKPFLSVEVTGGVVRIKFQKKGVDGVNIYCRRKGEVSFRFLARDTHSPYDDHIKLVNPSQPEHWEYRAYGVLNDVEIGQPSDVVEVIFGE